MMTLLLLLLLLFFYYERLFLSLYSLFKQSERWLLFAGYSCYFFTVFMVKPWLAPVVVVVVVDVVVDVDVVDVDVVVGSWNWVWSLDASHLGWGVSTDASWKNSSSFPFLTFPVWNQILFVFHFVVWVSIEEDPGRFFPSPVVDVPRLLDRPSRFRLGNARRPNNRGAEDPGFDSLVAIFLLPRCSAKRSAYAFAAPLDLVFGFISMCVKIVNKSAVPKIAASGFRVSLPRVVVRFLLSSVTSPP